MSESTVHAAQRGADNLLLDCLQLKPGESFLLVLEPDEALYQADVGKVMAERATAIGAKVEIITEPVIKNPDDFPASVANAMQRADHTLFLSRVGDYARFVKLPGEGTKTTSYTLDLEMLASPFASISHQLLATLRDKLEAELLAASEWNITCPLGTTISGKFIWSSLTGGCLLYTSPSPRDGLLSRMPSSA